jgi:hypothetical protein
MLTRIVSKMKNPIPKLYRDEPGAKIEPSKDGYELVNRPRPGRAVVRKTLSRSGKLKHDRLKALVKRGWEIKSISGVGSVVHPKHPNIVSASIAAAAVMEFGRGGKPPKSLK